MMPSLTYLIAGHIRYRPSSPERDWQYLRFVRTFPCVVCHTSRWIEAAHVGPHGLGQKASDTQSIPLCPKHHRTGPEALHILGPVKFQEKHQLDINALVTMFQHFYAEKLEASAATAMR